jgi:hypothetical protein
MRVERPDPQAAARREERRQKRAARREREFQKRTRQQLPEFEVVFRRLMERARTSAGKCAQRDKEHYRSRSREDLVNASFRSRLLTVLCKREEDWRVDDVARWLEMLGVGRIEVGEIVRQYSKRWEKIPEL